MSVVSLHGSPRGPSDAQPDIPPPDNGLSLTALYAIARRQYRVALGAVMVAGAVAVGYLATTPRSYTAETQLLIDAKRNGQIGLQTAGLADMTIDTGAVDSQVEILKSRKIAQAVIAEFNDRGSTQFSDERSALAQIRSWFRLSAWSNAGPQRSAEEEKFTENEAWLEYLGGNLNIKRVGRTYVMAISFTATDPFRAASIANSFTRAYLDDQFDANYEVTRRASEWMLTRIQELKQRSLETDLAVQKFRAEKNLMVTGKDGTLMSEQQLAEMNSQLMLARGETARAKAKYDRIQTIQKTGQLDAAVTESLGNPVIVELRNRYLGASKTEADLANRLGRGHAQVIKLRSEMGEYERLIFDELGRIAESLKSEVDIAQSREKSMEESLSSQVGVSAIANQDLVALRELERESATYQNLYQSILQRYQETVQKQSFPVSEARVLSAAVPPVRPSGPRSALVLAAALVLGGLIGAAIAALREFMDRGFRTSVQVAETLGLEFLGMMPRVTQRQLDKVPPPPANSPLNASAMMRYAQSVALSGFAETMRSAKVGIDIALGEKKPKIIGIISVLPHEGKSTTAKNIASIMAHLGARTLLVDGDLRNPSLTRELNPGAPGGLLEVLTEGADYRGFVLTEPDTKLDILLAKVGRQLTHTSELIASRAMSRFLADAGQDYDYIIIDLPPLGPVVDVRAAAKHFDGFIAVAEWGKTPRDVVASTLLSDSNVYDKCIGVILNKVDQKALALYQGYGAKEYYYGQYRAYYRERP